MNDLSKNETKEKRLINEMVKCGLLNEREIEKALSSIEVLKDKAAQMTKEEAENLISKVDKDTLTQLKSILENTK